MYRAVTLKRYNGCSRQEKTDFDGRFFFILYLNEQCKKKNAAEFTLSIAP